MRRKDSTIVSAAYNNENSTMIKNDEKMSKKLVMTIAVYIIC